MLIIMIYTCKRYLIALNTYWHFRAKAIISEKHETVRYGTGTQNKYADRKKKKRKTVAAAWIWPVQQVRTSKPALNVIVWVDTTELLLLSLLQEIECTWSHLGWIQPLVTSDIQMWWVIFGETFCCHSTRIGMLAFWSPQLNFFIFRLTYVFRS